MYRCKTVAYNNIIILVFSGPDPNSCELRTIKKCTPQLETALKGIDRDLVHFLCNKGFFNEDTSDIILNPESSWTKSQRAGEMVKWIKTRVELMSGSYYMLTDYLNSRGAFYQPIVKILNAEYLKQLAPLGGNIMPDALAQGHLGGDGAFSRAGFSPHGPATSPVHGKPTYQDYERCIPQNKLVRKIDFEQVDGVDLHLGELADALDHWEEVAPLLGLSDISISDIQESYPLRPAEQRSVSL